MVFELNAPLLTILLILFLGLLVPELFRKLKMPYVSVLILLGAVLGPFGFSYIRPNEVLEFFGFLGAAFLLLMAGLEVKISHLENLKKKIFILAAANGIIPMIVGITIVKLFGYPWTSAILVGIVFFSSSVAIIIPIIHAARLHKKEIGETIISAVVIEDIISLLLLAFVLQSVKPVTDFPLPVYFAVLIISVYILKRFLPGFAAYFMRTHLNKHHEDESQLRFVIVLLMAVLFYFSGIGVHPIIAAFLVGLLLADVITSKEVLQKIHTIAYGLFVPVFFFQVGMQIDITMLAHFSFKNVLMLSLITGLILAKFFSGYITSRAVKFSKKNSKIFGISSTAQLTTTLAASYAAASLGLLDVPLLTAIVIMSVITTIFSPLALNYVIQKTR